jgi:carboxypeptidase Taq
MIRFDLELEMLEGKLSIKDLPEAWNVRYESDLGIQPPNDTDGVMQDIHWYFASIGGMFQGYTLGNILTAMFYNAAVNSHPNIPSEIENGSFTTLHSWLTDNIYQHGRKFSTDELVERVTGSPITIKPYVSYLREKFGSLYQL